MQKPNKRLENQTCIVTGSSAGIGMAVAKAMGMEGANIVVNYHSSKEDAEEVADWIQKNSTCGDAIVVKCDVSKEKDVKAMFKKTIDHFGTVDVCVANAGMQIDHPLHEMPLEGLEKSNRCKPYRPIFMCQGSNNRVHTSWNAERCFKIIG